MFNVIGKKQEIHGNTQIFLLSLRHRNEFMFRYINLYGPEAWKPKLCPKDMRLQEDKTNA